MYLYTSLLKSWKLWVFLAIFCQILVFLAAKRAALESTMCGVCVCVIARSENSLSPFNC